MKVLIIGAGASGVACAINIKRRYPNDEIIIIEHLAKPLKKILATGNGKCNYGHLNIDFNQYNHPEFVQPIIQEFNTVQFFESLNVKTKKVDDLLYPMSESAETVRNAMLKECAHKGIKFHLSETLIDYEVNDTITVKTDKEIYKCDKLVFAIGGKSSPKLGSDGSLFNLFKKHGYEFIEPQPSLCPIKIKENIKELDGIRIKAKLTLDNHSEQGELLFKKDGLSGMVTFNMSRFVSLNKKQKILVDSLPEIDEKELKEYLGNHTKEEYAFAYFHPVFAAYLLKISKNNDDLIRNSKALSLEVNGLYDYEFSQVTKGGISITNLTSKLESKFEKNVYFIGEIIDVDAPCGGYNLTWAFASANYLH